MACIHEINNLTALQMAPTLQGSFKDKNTVESIYKHIFNF